ncbi:unnamed protein product, partial [Pylaiella littoralis]
MAFGGEILIEGTHVESWDMSGSGGVRETSSEGRSYLTAVSGLLIEQGDQCDGTSWVDNHVESRMDIIDSEINHLGYSGYSESDTHGISYEVRGICTDSYDQEIYASVGVTGDILSSHIHHLYSGPSSYGHQGGNWSYNEVHNNRGHGFALFDYSDEVNVNNNHVYNNLGHGILASNRCRNVTIGNNEIHENGDISESSSVGHGIMLNQSCDFSTITSNDVHDNMISGIALRESSNCEVSYNKIYNMKSG